MKRKIFAGLLLAEAVACVVLCALRSRLPISFVLAFPFEQIGSGLRGLSLSGAAGNAAAIIIYFSLSLIPVAVLLMCRRRGLRAEDALLPVLSAVLFAVMYFMINPAIGVLPGESELGLTVYKAIMGSMVYSVLCGYFIFRILRLFLTGGMEKLHGYMSVMIGVLSALFVYMAFGAHFGAMLESVTSFRSNENAGLLGVVFIVLRYTAEILPYLLNVFIAFAAMDLLEKMHRYSEETVNAADVMTRLCVVSLVVIVLSNIGINLLQLIFIDSLTIVNSTVEIPVTAVLIVLAALLLTRLVGDNKRLKDDNDMFV